MRYIEKLLEGRQVEWETLGEVIKLEKGKQLNKELLSETGLYPAYNGGVSFSGFTDVYNYNENTTIISQGGASAGFVNFVTTKFYANAHCYIILPKPELVENRYIFHFLKLNQEKLMNKQHGAGIPALRTSEILDIKIPIPPMDVQQEIVRILDKFTELTVELSAELKARKKQYAYYREELLMVNGEGLMVNEQTKDNLPFTINNLPLKKVEWKTLGEVAIIKNGKDWRNYNEGNIPVYGSGGIMTYIDTSVFDKPSVLIPRKGSLGNLFYVDIPFWTVDTIFWTDIDINIVIPKYLFYYLQTQELEKLNMAGGVPSLTQTILNKIKIPIPPLAEQERIVSILDKFDTLTNSISEGLPREIELRQKQYEYYRNKLLSF